MEAEGKKKRLPQSEDSPPQLSIKLPKLSDLPNTSKQWSDAELPIDILLLTVEDCEFLSCLAYLDNSFKSYRKEIGPVYYGAMGKGDQGKLKVAIIKCSKGSVVPGGSVTVLKNAVRILRPKAVFSVGACSGLTPVKAKLGDIIVSSKLTTPAFKTPVSRDIGKLIRYAADGWIPPLEKSDEREVKVHSEGDILSYPQAGGVGWSFEDIIQQYSEALAVDTEGEGESLIIFLPSCCVWQSQIFPCDLLQQLKRPLIELHKGHRAQYWSSFPLSFPPLPPNVDCFFFGGGA